MKRIFIQERDFIPGVILDKENGKFEITGKACPENMEEFYDPIFNWLDEYGQDPNENTTFSVKLIYYNTASSKALLKILQKLEKMQKNGTTVKIAWYYEKDDEELLIAGEDYAELIRLPFEFFVNNQ
ncbi:MAG: DUF1987 domain-containing protein [Bacteroidales bacterium]|nr:DUF1987 domain-containing protein [Bacteroidales bacterium]